MEKKIEIPEDAFIVKSWCTSFEEAKRGKPIYHVGRSQGPSLSPTLSLFSLSDLIQPKGFTW